jgi:cytochrome c oxidase subunit I+III
VLIFAAELTKLRWGMAVGAVIVTAAVIAWNWPQDAPMTVEEEDAFEREHQVPVNAGGSVIVAAWGTALVILVVAVGFAGLVLSYFYLRLDNPLWPPPGIPAPGLARATAAAALVVASGAAVRAALRRVRAADQRGFIAALAAALALAGGGAVVQLLDIAQLGFGWNDHAYGSIFFTLTGFIAVVAVAALIVVALTLYWATRGHYTARRHANVANITRFWAAMVVIWVIGFGTLYLGPHLT